jgi:hypothetical protein
MSNLVRYIRGYIQHPNIRLGGPDGRWSGDFAVGLWETDCLPELVFVAEADVKDVGAVVEVFPGANLEEIEGFGEARGVPDGDPGAQPGVKALASSVTKQQGILRLGQSLRHDNGI